MKTSHILPAALAATIALSGCSKLGSLSADNFTVTPNPLEAVSQKVPATVNGRFPEKYMKKKAVVTVVPVLRYANGQSIGQGATFQGEKVLGNDQTISYRLGGNYTMKTSFDYVPEMIESELYLTFDARLGNKKVNVPEVKVANGVLSTSALLANTVRTATTTTAADAYQYIIQQKQQAQIKFLIQQAKIRTSELKTTSVQDFIKTLQAIKADQKGFEIDNIEVSAYASPDGGVKLNSKLAENREKVSSKYVESELKKMKFEAPIDSKYTAEDWEGFQQLVSESNIQDKDVILRVLSMYKDPEEREQQIKNLSAGFRDLADVILPELRRARMTINYNVIGRSDEEILEQYTADASRLSIEELLYGASFVEGVDKQEDMLKTAVRLYPADYRAYNNLAQLAYAKGNYAEAKQWLDKADAKQGGTAEVNANRALLALVDGNTDKAEEFLSHATTVDNYNEILGNLLVAEGRYPQAASALAGVKSNSAALAQILAKDYRAAQQALDGVAAPDAMTDYLKAIVAARTANDRAVLESLRAAFAKDASLRARAAKDLEFVSLFADSSFRALVR